MPINREQFDAGLTDEMTEWMTLTHDFLREHKDEAYTEEELRQQVQRTIRVFLGSPQASEEADQRRKPIAEIGAGPTTKDDLKAFGAALHKLVELEGAEKKLAGGLQYYAYKRDLPNPA